MMKKSKILAFVMLMIFSVGAIAQVNPVNSKKMKNQKNGAKARKSIKDAEENSNENYLFTGDSTAVLVGNHNDNWYFGVSAGVHMFSGNEEVPSARINPITPQLGLKFGKWLTPSIALSADLDLGFAKGQSRNNVYVPNKNGQYHSFTFFYYDLYGEVTLDWMSLTTNYARSSRMKYHLQNTIGMGYAWQTGKAGNPDRKGNVSNYEMSFHFGFNNDIRLNNRVNLFIEPKLTLIKGTWDYSPMSNTWGKMDYMISLSIGAKFGLGKKSRHSFAAGSNVGVDEIRKIQKDYEKLEQDNKISAAEKEAKIDSLNNVVDRLKDRDPIPMQILDVMVDDNLKYVEVHFRIGEATVEQTNETSLMIFAEKINRAKDDVKFMIISSADKGTGTPESNMVLTQKRCDAVYNILVDKYGVNPDRLEKYPIGGIDHYEPDYMNRMTLVVEKNDNVIKILQRHSEKQK